MRTAEDDGDPVDDRRTAGGARPEVRTGTDVGSRYEERVALTVTEAIDDAATVATRLTDDLVEDFRLAPVLRQVILLRDYHRLSASVDQL